MSLRSFFSDVFMPEAPICPVGPSVYDRMQDKLSRAGIAIARQQIAPSREEFRAWREDPTTRFVMAALERNAEECREEWLRKSWNAGNADQMTLVGLRERSDALLGFTADYEAFCETLGLDPEPEEEQAA